MTVLNNALEIETWGGLRYAHYVYYLGYTMAIFSWCVEEFGPAAFENRSIAELYPCVPNEDANWYWWWGPHFKDPDHALLFKLRWG